MKKIQPDKYVVLIMEALSHFGCMRSEPDIQVFLTNFGKRVKALREEHDLTQLDLAAKAEMDVRQIQRIEAGDINTSIGNAYLIARGFELEVSALFAYSKKLFE